MPLIKCPDCSTEVSDQAPACTKCGRPLGKASGDTVLTRNRGCADMFLLMILVGVVSMAGCVVCVGSHH